MYDDYFLIETASMATNNNKKPANKWVRAVPPPPPPSLWLPDQTTLKNPDPVWCEHCQDITRWCPIYGANTLEEAWKVFDEVLRKEQERLNIQYEERHRRREEEIEFKRKKREREAKEAREQLQKAREERKSQRMESNMSCLRETYKLFRSL